MAMNISISDEQMSTIVSKAIFESLSAEDRDKLIQGAIASLLIPERGGVYGSKKSPLESAFLNAASIAAHGLAIQELEGDTVFQLRLKELIHEATERVFTTDREKILNSIVNAISRGFERD